MQQTELFPSQKDYDRIIQETRWFNLLTSNDSGNYKLSMNPMTGLIERKKVDPMVPIASSISDINGDLLFGEFPNIIPTADNEKLIKAWREFNFYTDMQSKYIEASNAVSAQGTGFCRFWVEQGETFYEFIKSSDVVWTEDYKGLKDVQIIENIEQFKNNSETWYEIQKHSLEDGKHVIEHYYIITMTGSREFKSVQEIEAPIYTGLKFIPVIKCVNMGRIGSKTGRSDYEGKEQLFSEIDNRIDQNNRILEDNADPWIGLPAGILDANGQFQRRFGKMFERGISGNGDNEVNIISYGAESIIPSMEHTKQMIEMCFFTSRISAPIAGLTNVAGGQADSGRALKWKSINTMSMINRKRVYWSSFIRNFVYTWGVLSGYGEIDKSDILIEWQDGLPMDDTEVIDNVVKKVGAKVISRQKAIETINEMDKVDAEAELARIDSEEVTRLQRESVNLGNAISI